MRSISHLKWIEAVFDELDAEQRRCSELSFHALTTPELWALLERCEFLMGRLAAVEYELTSPFARQAGAGPIRWRGDLGACRWSGSSALLIPREIGDVSFGVFSRDWCRWAVVVFEHGFE
jgi:hypothetical protein